MKPPLADFRPFWLLLTISCAAVAVRPVWKTPVSEKKNSSIPLRIPRARNSQLGDIRYSPQHGNGQHQGRPYYTRNEDFQIPNYNPAPPRRPYYTRPEDYQIPFYQPQPNIQPGRIYRPPYTPPGFSAPRRPFYPQNNPYRNQGPLNQGLYPPRQQVPNGFPVNQGGQYPNGFYPGGGQLPQGQGHVQYPQRGGIYPGGEGGGFQGPNQVPAWPNIIPPNAVPYLEGAESIPPQGAFGPKPPTKSPMIPGIRPETYTGTIPMQPSWNPQDWEKFDKVSETTQTPEEVTLGSLFTASSNPYETGPDKSSSPLPEGAAHPEGSPKPNGGGDKSSHEGIGSTEAPKEGNRDNNKRKEVTPSSAENEKGGQSSPPSKNTEPTPNPYKVDSVTEKTPAPISPYFPRPMHPQPVQPPSVSPEFSPHIDVKLLPPTCAGPLCGIDKHKVSVYTPQMGSTLLISNTVKNGLTGGTFMSPVTHMPSPSVPERKLLPFVPGPFIEMDNNHEVPHVFMQPHELTEQIQSSLQPTTLAPYIPTAKTKPYTKSRTTTTAPRPGSENPYGPEEEGAPPGGNHGGVPPGRGGEGTEQPGRGPFGNTKNPNEGEYVTGVPPGGNHGGVPPGRGGEGTEQPGRGPFGNTKNPNEGEYVTGVPPGGNHGGVPPGRGGEGTEQPGRGPFGNTKHPNEGENVTGVPPGGNHGGVPSGRGGEGTEQPGRGPFGNTKNPNEGEYVTGVPPGGNHGGVPPGRGGEGTEQPGRGPFGNTKNPNEGEYVTGVPPGGNHGGVPPGRGGEGTEQPGRGPFGNTKHPNEGENVTGVPPGGNHGGVPPGRGGEGTEQPGRGPFGNTKNPNEGENVTGVPPGGNHGGVPPGRGGEGTEQPGRGPFGNTKNPNEGEYVTGVPPGGNHGGVPPGRGGEGTEQPGRGPFGNTKHPNEGENVTGVPPGGNHGGVPPGRGGEGTEQPGRGPFGNTKNPNEGENVTGVPPGGNHGGVPPGRGGEGTEQPGRGPFGNTKNPNEGEYVTGVPPGGNHGGVPPGRGGEGTEQPGRGPFGNTKNPNEVEYVTGVPPGGNHGGVPPGRGGEGTEQPGRGPFGNTKNPNEGENVTGVPSEGNHGGVPPGRGGEGTEQPGRGPFGNTKNPNVTGPANPNEVFTTPTFKEETVGRFAELTTKPSVFVPTYKTKAPVLPTRAPIEEPYPTVPHDLPPRKNKTETSTTPYYSKERTPQGYGTSHFTNKPFVPNRIRGKFRVVCLEEGIEFGIVTIFPFTGSIFANEKRRVPGCMKTFSSDATPSVFLPFKECGRKNPSDNDHRTQYHMQVVVEIEQEDGSTTIQSFMTQCLQQNIKYTKQTLPNRIEETLEELRLVPARLEQKAPLPEVEMKIVVDEHHHLGPEVISLDDNYRVVEVDIGMPLAIQWSLIGESDAYGFHVKNCFVQDKISGMQMMLIDEHGCSTDVTILHHPHYDTYHDTASAHMWAFKVPDHTSMNIKCDITICSDIASSSTNISSCATIPSPPYCPDLITSPMNSILFDAEGAFAKRRRETEAEEETQTVRAALCMGEHCSKVNSADRLTCVSTAWFILSSSLSLAIFLLALTINVSVRISLSKPVR